MNALRRAKLAQALELLRQVVEEEWQAFEKLPESIQMSKQGETMDENATTLEMCIDELETIE